jgi:hypothetical protein
MPKMRVTRFWLWFCVIGSRARGVLNYLRINSRSSNNVKFLLRATQEVFISMQCVELRDKSPLDVDEDAATSFNGNESVKGGPS